MQKDKCFIFQNIIVLITYERLKEENVIVKEKVFFVSVYECLCKLICVCILYM